MAGFGKELRRVIHPERETSNNSWIQSGGQRSETVAGASFAAIASGSSAGETPVGGLRGDDSDVRECQPPLAPVDIRHLLLPSDVGLPMDMSNGSDLGLGRLIFESTIRDGYNGYWLFLGPCGAHDPGHRRVYFESSENGYWEVIDTRESAMPEEALMGAWTKSAHKLWVKWLRHTSSMAELLQVFADFVGAINEDWLNECNVQQVSYNLVEKTIASFASMPQTSSVVALWLVKLDALIAPYLERVHYRKKQEISTKGIGLLYLSYYMHLL
ncbi:homeobox-DDT domain protein RLT3 isoform X2 [Fagus crenata]